MLRMKQFNRCLIAVCCTGLCAAATARANVVINSVTLNGESTATVAPGATIAVSVTATITSGDDWRATRWNSGGSNTCIDHQNFSSNGQHTVEFDITAPNQQGTYTLTFRPRRHNDCSWGNTSYPNFIIEDALTVCDDADEDGVCDEEDNCPDDYNPDQEDADEDGVGDACDDCPNDPHKTEPGLCGCGVADTDTDEDGTPDCLDGCPNDPHKTEPGLCGCGVADTDSDNDGTADCLDGCPTDPFKTNPGLCGCGVPDTDTDGDGTPDCLDQCPNDPHKTVPGINGCGIPEPDNSANDDDPGDDDSSVLPAQELCGIPCGSGLLGMMPLLMMMIGMSGLRRRTRRAAR